MPDPTTTSDLLNIAEAARFFGRSQRWVYRRIKDGAIPAFKIGGLYFIRRGDLQEMVEQGRVLPGTGPLMAETQTGELGAEQQKCGYCFRILDDSQIGAVCRTEGCNELICTQCLTDGVQHCARHFPSRDQRWEAAQGRFQHKEIPVLVKANHARLLEINFTNRIQDRLARFSTLINPTSGELINIPNWDALLSAGDERAQIMHLLGKVALETTVTSSTPLNGWLVYRLPSARGKKGLALEIRVQTLSHLPEIVRDGFVERPFGVEDLLPWVQRLAEESASSQTFKIFLLAATSGWDVSARQVVHGKPGSGALGTALVQRLGLIYLFDLQTGELLYNTLDERARRYAELFTTLLPTEELSEAVTALEKELGARDTITLQYAIQVLPYSPRLVRQAFDELVRTGHFAFLDVPQLGLAIIRSGV